jgi:hypothetical protein
MTDNNDVLNRLNYIFSRLVIHHEKNIAVTEYDLELLELIIKDILKQKSKEDKNKNIEYEQKKEFIRKYISLLKEEESLKQQFFELYNQNILDCLEVL